MSSIKKWLSVCAIAGVVSACGSAPQSAPLGPVGGTGVGGVGAANLNGVWALASYAEGYGADISVGNTESWKVESAFQDFFGYNNTVSNAFNNLNGGGYNSNASFKIQFSNNAAFLILATPTCSVSIPLNINNVNSQGFSTSPISLGGQTFSMISLGLNGKTITATGSSCGTFATANAVVQAAGTAVNVGYFLSGANQLSLAQTSPKQMVFKFQKQQ